MSLLPGALPHLDASAKSIRLGLNIAPCGELKFRFAVTGSHGQRVAHGDAERH